jgi:hypothetical protein
MMPTLRISRAELAAAAFALGVTNPATIRKWFHRETIPNRMQIRLMNYFGANIEISDWSRDAVASIARPKTISDICREKFLTPSGLS